LCAFALQAFRAFEAVDHVTTCHGNAVATGNVLSGVSQPLQLLGCMTHMCCKDNASLCKFKQCAAHQRMASDNEHFVPLNTGLSCCCRKRLCHSNRSLSRTSCHQLSLSSKSFAYCCICSGALTQALTKVLTLTTAEAVENGGNNGTLANGNVLLGLTTSAAGDRLSPAATTIDATTTIANTGCDTVAAATASIASAQPAFHELSAAANVRGSTSVGGDGDALQVSECTNWCDACKWR
jgi:hypothetical protein